MAPDPMEPFDNFKKEIETYTSSADPSSAVDSTAASLAKIVASNIPSDASEEDTQGALWSLWGATWTVARSTSSPATTIPALVDLVRALKAQEPLKTDTGTTLTWSELPVFGWQAREEWNYDPRSTKVEEWENLNMFAALLTRDKVFDFEIYAIWSLRQSLEEGHPLTRREVEEPLRRVEDEPLEMFLPGAVVWMEHAADYILALCKEGKSFEKGKRQGDPARPGSVAKEKGLEHGGFDMERWNFWRSQFEEISAAKDDAGGREKVAKIAYQAVQKMDAVNKGLHG